MISKEFLKMTDDKLKFLLKNKDRLIKVPGKLDEKVISEIKAAKIIEKEEKKSSTLFYPRYALAFSFIFIIIISSFLFFYLQKLNSNLIINSFQATGNVKVIRNKKEIKLSENKIIRVKDLIKVGSNSQIKLKLIKDINLEINNNSEVVLSKVKKYNKNYNIGFFLRKGEIINDVKLSSSKSSFTIETKKAFFSTAGTKFKLKILENDDIRLDVFEGIVKVFNFINKKEKLKIIKNNSYGLYTKIINFQEKNLFVEKDNTITLNVKELDNINNEFDEIVNSIYDKLKQNEKLSISDNSFFEEKLNNLNKLLEQKIFEKEQLQKEKSQLYLEKINSLNITLNELNTSITSDNQNIYLTSDNKKSIYCVDSNTGNLLWKFSNPDIKKINTSALSLDNNIFVQTTDKLFILNKNGKLNKTVKLGEGSVFWASGIIVNKTIYMPTLYSIYKYNNNVFTEIKKDFYLNGQIYLSSNNNDIYINALNDKQLSSYSLQENSLLKFKEKLSSRSFNAPVYGDGFIYIADTNKNLYKYNAGLPDIKPEKISLSKTIVSNLIYQDNLLFFICDDGYFYEIETRDLSNINKITHIENNPTIDKFLTKKLFYKNGKIYFSSNKGNIFCYDLDIKDFKIIINNYNKLPFIGTPVLSNSKIVVVDLKFNIYEIKN